MNDTIFATIVAAIGGVLVALIGKWTRKKPVSMVEEFGALIKANNEFREAITNELEKVKNELRLVRLENMELRKENETLRKENKDLKEKVRELENQLNTYIKKKESNNAT